LRIQDLEAALDTASDVQRSIIQDLIAIEKYHKMQKNSTGCSEIKLKIKF